MEIVPSLGRQVKVLSGVLVNRHISSWTNAPDWIMFERYFSKLPNPQTNEYLNIVLSIETVPVPKSTVATLLAYDSKAIDEQSLLVAFRQSCSTRDVLHQLLDHIIQFQMTHLIRLALRSLPLDQVFLHQSGCKSPASPESVCLHLCCAHRK